MHISGCGHCKRAKPEFTEAAEEMKDEDRVLWGAVDCTKHSSLCSQYHVKGYPTIKIFTYFNKEEPIEFDGSRDVS